jgi:cytochrome c oxidase subunit 3
MSSTSAIEMIPHAHKDHMGARIGMWLFLFTEVLLFTGMFLLYAVYRGSFPEDFHYGATTLDVFMGTFNTIILLTSSLTMVLACASFEKRNRRNASIFIGITIFFAFLFLVNKYFEWSAKFHHGLYPNSEIMQQHTPGENVFYSLYYLMTGLHGLHILLGIGLLSWMLWQVKRKPRRKIRLSGLDLKDVSLHSGNGSELWKHGDNDELAAVDVELVYQEHEDVSDRQMIKLENVGLYWHLVDVIWIFLFPLFYLIT